MPRTKRIVIAGVPLHITQRGVDRCPTFHSAEDFAFYRWALEDALGQAGCSLHAYVLMSNHVHLLLTPADAEGPAALFRSLGGRYVKHFNAHHRRTGTLWEGRFRSALVDSGPYLFTCSRYIELNPVRAQMTDEPRAYPWSSIHHNVGGLRDPLITEHAAYLALGGTREARLAAYRSMFSASLAADTIAAFRAEQLSRRRGIPSGDWGHRHAGADADERPSGSSAVSSETVPAQKQVG